MSSLGVLSLVVAFLAGWEIVLILAVVLILFGAKHLPDLWRRLGQGLLGFRDALDDEAHDAGRSIGGIHGKPAAEALTTDNQVAEFYDQDAFRYDKHSQWWRGFIQRFVRILSTTFEDMNEPPNHAKQRTRPVREG